MSTFPCTFPDCAYVAKKKWILVQHMRQHNGEKPYPCRIPGCAFAFASRSGQVRHESTHGKPHLKCPDEGCNYIAGNNSAMARHTRKEGHGAGLPCPHPNCDMLFKSYAVLKMHKRGPSHSGEGGKSECKACAITFDTTAEYMEHVRAHRVERLVAFTQVRAQKRRGIIPQNEV